MVLTFNCVQAVDVKENASALGNLEEGMICGDPVELH